MRLSTFAALRRDREQLRYLHFIETLQEYLTVKNWRGFVHLPCQTVIFQDTF